MSTKRKHDAKTFHFGKKKRGRDHSQNFKPKITNVNSNLSLNELSKPIAAYVKSRAEVLVNENELLDPTEIFVFDEESPHHIILKGSAKQEVAAYFSEVKLCESNEIFVHLDESSDQIVANNSSKQEVIACISEAVLCERNEKSVLEDESSYQAVADNANKQEVGVCISEAEVCESNEIFVLENGSSHEVLKSASKQEDRVCISTTELYEPNEIFLLEHESSHKISVNSTSTHGVTVNDAQLVDENESFFLEDEGDNDYLEFDEFINDDELCQPDVPEDEETEIHQMPQEKFQTDCDERQKAHKQSLEGNRIVDLRKLFQDIRRLNSHSDESCNFNDMVFIRETKFGFKSRLTFCCEKCGYLDYLNTTSEDDEQPNINLAAVLATLSVGMSYSTLVEFSSVLNIPSMTKSTYYTREREWHTIINDVAENSMKQVAEAEKHISVERGKIDERGNILMSCYVDTAWCKRSYRTSYSARSGAATIIGEHTKKVLWNGVANKSCRICESAASAQTQPTEHKCNKNFSGPSTAMEPKLLKDGFMECEQKYNIRFSHFVGDGDASVLLELNNAQIYRNPALQIVKYECRNHLFKGARGGLHKLAGKPNLKDYLDSEKIEKIVYYIRCARKHWVESTEPYRVQIENLRKDIYNIPYHLFGDHTRCASYFCKGAKDGERNIVPTLVANKSMNQIQDALARVRLNAKSVLKNETTNIVKQFNSLIVKYTGGKRVNFSSSGSFQARDQLAVIQHNTGTLLSTLFQAIGKKPNAVLQNIEELRLSHNEYNAKTRKNTRKKNSVEDSTGPDEYYGTFTCRTPDMNHSNYEFEKQRYIEELALRYDNRVSIEHDTKAQADDDNWKSVRHGMITSLHFGNVCIARSPKTYAAIVESIMYGSERGQKQVQHDLTYQSNAIDAFEREQKLEVVKSGFFIDENHHFLGASPYGTIDHDAIVEVICPLSFFGKNVTECIFQEKNSLWIKDKNKKNITGVNVKHKEYYKIQGALHVTNRQICYYVVWSGDDEAISITKIERDDTFWMENMKEKLTKFYEKALLPEVVNPRKARKMKLRQFDKDGNLVS